jgi:hypothetical protein
MFSSIQATIPKLVSNIKLKFTFPRFDFMKPQGMHLLELAKTAWNARISSNQISKTQVLAFLTLARKGLEIYGPEGDESGPLDEIKTLERLLSVD